MRVEAVDPGQLRTELVLERVVLTPDGQGGHVEEWVAVATLFAQLRPAAARGTFGADQTLEAVTHDVTVRARGDVASGMRLRLAERIFDIVTAHDPDETGRYLLLRTREVGR